MMEAITPVRPVLLERWRRLATFGFQSPWTIDRGGRDGFHPYAGVTQQVLRTYEILAVFLKDS